MRRGLRRVPVPTKAQPDAKFIALPSPTRGWVANENLAMAQAAGARVLINWFPTLTGIRARGGCRLKATIGSGSDPVLCQFTYKVGTTEKHFATTATDVYEITSPVDPDVSPTADISGQTGGYYSTTQMTTAGGTFLVVVNGFDDAQYYDGSTWEVLNASSSPIAITGVATSALSFIWNYANRIFAIEKFTMNVWYLAVDSIGGAMSRIALQGVFKKGGYLVFGGTWSMDAGDGLDDKCVFVTSEGEVAVFQGIDPSDPDNWSKVGVYDITSPMGTKCTIKAGGDLVIASEAGMVPLSVAIDKDPAALSLAAVSRAIAPEWEKEVTQRRTQPWECITIPRLNMAVVSQPVVNDTQDRACFVVNVQSGAWCKYIGWEIVSMVEFGGNGFFGNSSGQIFQMEAGGSDNGLPYTCSYSGQPDHIKAIGRYKSAKMARATFLTSLPEVNAQLSVSANYKVAFPSAPSSIANFTADEWDVGLWDVMEWDGGSAIVPHRKLRSVAGAGDVFAPQVQVTFGIDPTPYLELVLFELSAEIGQTAVSGT